ncbi:hypothetical protein [Actinomadura parmotrematis]|uniref:Uncharacterized protein n=1 Tax=Actinomadura parmotrematis TaxID=2864039 RepID=A0ABS7FY02_9ACTN|nr:hypothetical protein [Actinomadura parmotrematis]MBW8484328.1 hypothetical protein [Actinomadura parmotrematis]
MADDSQPVFDEDFVKGAAYTEPSAAERARRPGRRERLRARRAALRARRAVRAGARRTGPDPVRAGRRAVVQVIAGLLVLLLLSVGLWWMNRPKASSAPPGAAKPPSAVVPPLPSTDPRDPFAASPAADYASGAAGIALPPPAAAAGMSAAQVKEGLDRVRLMMIAANLDEATVFRGDSSSFRKTLEPAQLAQMKKDLDDPRRAGAAAWVTTFAPGSAEQTVRTVKVHGTGSAAAAERDGRKGLMVKTDHNFVYAVHPPARPDAVQRVVQRWTSDYFVYAEGGEVHVWITKAVHYSAPVRCDVKDGLVHPQYSKTSPGAGPGGANQHDPYDLSRPIAPSDVCGRVAQV